MSIAEKLQTIAENELKVYEAGRRAEYNAFWDGLQHNGSTDVDCRYMFFYWEDSYYNPKYPVRSSRVYMNNVYNNALITDTKVDVDVSLSENAQNIFQNASKLKRIRKFIVSETVALGGAFTNCSSLEDIVVEGYFGVSMNFQYSKLLTKASIVSIVNAMSPNISGLSLTLSLDAVNNAFEGGSTGAEWLALAGTRSNCTINLV